MKNIFCLILILNITSLYSWDWPWANYTLDKRGVEITFPSQYEKDPGIGNSNFGLEGAYGESYSTKEKYGILGINFISSSTKNTHSTLDELMYAGIRSANGTFKSKKFFSIDGVPILEYLSFVDYRSQGGPIVYMKEQLFRLDSYTFVNVKFVGRGNAIDKQEVTNFFSSLKLR